MRHEAAVPNIEARLVPLDDPEMLPEPERATYSCEHCRDDMCKGTGIYEGRKCDGIPF